MAIDGNLRRKGLGRGLASLIVNTDPHNPAGEEVGVQAEAGVRMAPIDTVLPNPQQPRSRFDPAALEELAASIREHGIIQPLIVTTAPTAHADSDAASPPSRRPIYWLVAGERRLRAAALAKLAEVPVIVRDASPQQLVEWALVENVQRADLNPLEEATAYHTLVEEFSLTQAQIGQRVGKSRSAVANTLRLLQLPEPIQAALIDNRISAGHARALLALPDRAMMDNAYQRILARDLTVRQTEELVRTLLTQDAQSAAPTPEPEPKPDSQISFLENRFRTALGTRVNLNRNNDGSGRLVVHFYSDDDLNTIYQHIVGIDEPL